jgi:hypothetical protein
MAGRLNVVEIYRKIHTVMKTHGVKIYGMKVYGAKTYGMKVSGIKMDGENGEEAP